MRDSARRLAAAATAAVVLLATGCSGSAIEDVHTAIEQQLVIGMVVSQTGVYKTVGDDMVNGLKLYLDQHGGQLGGRTVDLVIEDEAEGGAPARAAAEKLITSNKAVALTGVVGGGSVAAIKPLLDQHQIPLIGSNARPTSMPNLDWVWQTSYISTEPGIAMGDYVAQQAGGPVWVICPDYQGGYDECNGFKDAFLRAGGKLANPDQKIVWTPFPMTKNFQPYLTQILQSDAKAVYTFYAGGAAIDFVKQYRQFVGDKLPLFAAGFLTEGSVLGVQGDAAKGIRNSLNYSPDLDNAANKRFVADYQAKYQALPTTFAMASYDAGAVLDKAIAAAAAKGEVTGKTINEAVAGLGQIDSPRGVWQFSTKTHTPVQTWYLREVRTDGRALTNVVLQELATIGG
ncbi:ABC transporter substrate-binding protein [Catellatospora bangladeshensis]|uniref:ABC transporter substrate-binding protein n=1 Tax=Catellatospora bangladeshensis TaxID=310355 RepID=A0A8J3JS55_9ACTN|nr:ABC transporter substrate-binding protein [Catellatospora bangladeshensis]GIF86041.1 ABC transporter substrate-binding protein [Catellatospora bangladeshensis]